MDDFEQLTVTNNLIKRIEALEADLRSLQMRDASATQLTEISDDAGVIRAGAFVCGDGDPLNNTDAPFTGVALLQPGIDPAGTGASYNLVGMNAGTLEAGISAVDGKFYAGGGEMVLDRNGMAINVNNSMGNTIAWLDGAIQQARIYLNHTTTVHKLWIDVYPPVGGTSQLTLNATSFPSSPYLYHVQIEVDVAGNSSFNSATDANIFTGSMTLQNRDVNTFITTGWINDASTWTYASASTFTISGDQTARFTKGTRLKWTQTTVKYGVVASSAYSSGTGLTTVTIVVNTDYVISNAAITLPYYSNLAAPVGWPGWFNYTASFTGFSSNPTSVISRYNIIGNVCTIAHTEGADGTSNANSFTVSLPVAASASCPNIVVAAPFARDNGAAINNASVTVLTSGTTAGLRTAGYATGWTASGAKRAFFNVSYEW